MWKFFRYVLYLIIIVLIFSVTYKYREYYYIPFIQNYLNKVTDSKLKFRNFDISYKDKSLELCLYNIEYNNEIFLDKAALRFEPLIFKKDYNNLKTPLKSLTAVNLSNITIIKQNKNNKNTAEHLQQSHGIIKDFASEIQKHLQTDIFLGRVNLIYNDELIKVTDIKMSVAEQINISANISLKQYVFPAEGNINFEKDFVCANLKINTEGYVKAKFAAFLQYSFLNKTFICKSKTDKLTIGRLVFGKVSLDMAKDKKQFTINAKGDFGKISFIADDADLKKWSSKGNIKIKDAADIFALNISYNASKDTNFDLSADINNITVLGSNCGNLTIKADSSENGNVNFEAIHNLGNKLAVLSEENGTYNVSIYNKKIKIGTLKGNYKNGTISADIKNLPINKLMFLSSKNKKVTGSLSLYGNIKKTGGSIILNAVNLSSRRLKKFDVSSRLLKQKDKWSFNIATKDRKLVLKTVYYSKNKNTVNFFYSNIDFNNIMNILGFGNISIFGKASGYIKYNSELSNTKFNIKLKNGLLYENKFNNWDISGNISTTELNISSFNFAGVGSSINLKTSLSFSKDNPDSYLNCNIKNFKINGAKINGNLSFAGHVSDDESRIEGQLFTNNFTVNNLHFDNKASLILTTKQIILKGIKDTNNITGKFIYNLKNKTVKAALVAKKAQISKYYDKIKGFINLNFSMNGHISKPKINLNYNIQNALYNGIKFSSKASAVSENNFLNLKNFTIVSGGQNGFQINASGKINLSDTNISFKFKNLSEKEINKFMGFRTPLKGLFYGDGTVSGKINNLHWVLSIFSDELFIKTMKFNSLKSKIDMKNKTIVLTDGVIKYKDSEIKIPSAQFNMSSGKYNSVFKLINTYAGPFDIFGQINLKGKMKKQKSGSVYSGNILFENIWLNRQTINKLPINYKIAGRKFNFSTGKRSEFKANGVIDFSKYPYIALKNISIADKNMVHRVFFNGKVSDKEINLNAVARNIQSSLLADTFDFPFDIEGYVNLKLNSSGSVEKPLISLTANSKSGKIFGITYDNLDIKNTVKDNIFTINRFKIDKINEFTTRIKGSFPFAIDSALKNKIKDKKVNVSYEFKDNKLNTIKEFTNGEVTAKKGNFTIKGTIKGTLKNTTSTGEITAGIAGITTNSYIHKFKNLNLTVKWKDNLLKIEDFAARAGSGFLNISGDIKLTNLMPSFYNLSVFTNKKGIPIVIKELPIPTSGFFKIEKTDTFTNYSKGVPTFDLKLYGKSTEPKLTGWIKLENTKFCFPSPVKINNKSKFSLADIFPKLFIDIDLLSATSTNFENSFTNAYLKGKVNLKGDINDIKSNGIVESSNGRLSYMGNDFNLINSKIEIINNDIFISGEAETEMYSSGDSEAETIRVNIERSHIDNIKTRFSSKNDPSLDSQKVLAHLTRTEPSQFAPEMSTDFFVKQQAVRMLNSNVAVPLANTILKKTGVVDNVRVGYINQDNVKLEDNEEATLSDLLYGMKYSVEKNINRLLQIGYSVTFDQINKETEEGKEKEIDLKHALELSFKINKDLFLKGSYGLNSDNELYEPEKKVMLEQRIRFGGASKKNKKK